MKKRFLVGISLLLFGANMMLAQALLPPLHFTSVYTVSITPSPFYTQIPGANPVPLQTIKYTLTWMDSSKVGGITEQIINNLDQVVCDLGGSNPKQLGEGTYTRTWDGKYNVGASSGQYVPDAMYRLKIATDEAYSYTSQPFSIAKAVGPYIALNGNPLAVYYSSGGTNFDVNYTLKGNSAATTDVQLRIFGPSNNPVAKIMTDTKNADGNYAISWDGKINNAVAATGDYTWTLSSKGVIKDAQDYTMDGNTLNGTMYVNSAAQAQPTLSNISVSENPYNPTNGDLTLGYTLSGSLNLTTIQAVIYNANDPNTTIKSWSFTNQGNGNNSVPWNGRYSNNNIVSNGSYVFKVWGQDGNYSVNPLQTSFTVNSTGGSQTGGCAGFVDVSDTSPDCNAVSYVKNIGAMTGNPNGTFDPSSSLQRDQIAKISLETFNKIVSNFDYCKSTNPFPDVASNTWAYQYICRGKELGMITGYKSGVDLGYYRPARSVNRVEFLAIILRNLNDNMPAIGSPSYTDVDASQWYGGFAKYSYDNSLFSGTKLYPSNMVTRVEVARVLYKLHLLGKI